MAEGRKTYAWLGETAGSQIEDRNLERYLRWKAEGSPLRKPWAKRWAKRLAEVLGVLGLFALLGFEIAWGLLR